MIDKGMLYRENFRGGGMDMGNASNQAQSAAMGGGGGGNNNQGGDYSAPGTLSDPREKMDYVGPTAFGPTQKYSGDGFFSGYRNLDRKGQPLTGLAYLGDRLKSFASKINPLSLIGGLVAGPVGSFVGRGISSLGALRNYDTLSDYAKGEFGLFQDEDENQTIDIRDIYNRLGVTPTGITNINLGMLPRQRDLVKTGRLQEFQNLPPDYIESLLEDEETMYP